MPIIAQCPKCGKKLRAPEDRVGRQAKCPDCKADFTIVAITEGPAGAAKAAGEAAVAARGTAGAGHGGEAKVALASKPQKQAGGNQPAAATTPAVATLAVGRAKWFVRLADGNDFGPVSKEELDTWLAEDRLDADCQLLQEGSDQWKWAEEVYPQLGSPAASGELFAGIGATAARVEPVIPVVMGVEKPHVARHADLVPTYFWLNFLGGLFTVVGGVIMGLGALAGIIVLMLGLAGVQTLGAGSAAAGAFTGLWIFVFSFLAGAFWVAGGQALFAFRDIALNSWKVISLLRDKQT